MAGEWVKIRRGLRLHLTISAWLFLWIDGVSLLRYDERTAYQPHLPAIVARNPQGNASGCGNSFGWARCWFPWPTQDVSRSNTHGRRMDSH